MKCPCFWLFTWFFFMMLWARQDRVIHYLHVITGEIEALRVYMTSSSSPAYFPNVTSTHSPHLSRLWTGWVQGSDETADKENSAFFLAFEFQKGELTPEVMEEVWRLCKEWEQPLPPLRLWRDFWAEISVKLFMCGGVA